MDGEIGTNADHQDWWDFARGEALSSWIGKRMGQVRQLTEAGRPKVIFLGGNLKKLRGTSLCRAVLHDNFRNVFE